MPLALHGQSVLVADAPICTVHAHCNMLKRQTGFVKLSSDNMCRQQVGFSYAAVARQVFGKGMVEAQHVHLASACGGMPQVIHAATLLFYMSVQHH